MIPFFSIVIPTRERADTLVKTLETCISQSEDSFEVIVCDNYSGDQTGEVVNSIDDPRLVYLNPGKRLGMASNWEYALERVRGQYVMVLGDDDGLVPGGLTDLKSIIKETRTTVVSWVKAEYCWPNHPKFSGLLMVPSKNNLFQVRSKFILRSVLSGMVSYSRTPTIYNSVIQTSVLRSLKNRTGKFFHSVVPDVYSGIAVLSEVDSYLYSIRPFSVNGASPHSNGTAHINNAGGELASIFYREMDLPICEDFPFIRGSVNSSIYEAICQADRHCFNGRLKSPQKWMFKRVLAEMVGKGPEMYQSAIDQFSQLASFKQSGLKTAMIGAPNLVDKILPSQLGFNGFFSIGNTSMFIHDIVDACNLTGEILGYYSLPAVHSMGWTTLGLSWLVRRLFPKFLDRSL